MELDSHQAKEGKRPVRLRIIHQAQQTQSCSCRQSNRIDQTIGILASKCDLIIYMTRNVSLSGTSNRALILAPL